jgi:hypothetical protein
MTLARYDRTVTDNQGNVVAGATVTVRVESIGQPLAQLYSDRDGLSAIGNPISTDANGDFGFYVEVGTYQIEVVNGGDTKTLRYVDIGVIADAADIVVTAAPDDLAALKNVDTATTMAALLKEDGRDGFFAWAAGDFSADVALDTSEGVFVKAAAIAATAGAWRRQTGVEYLASWFGASTSASAAANTTAINAAIEFAEDRGGGVVWIGPGTYAVNTILLRPNVRLVGAGIGATVLNDTRSDANAVIKAYDNTSSNLWMAVCHLKVSKPNGTSGAVCIDMTSWQQCEVYRTWLVGSSAAGTSGIICRGLYSAGPVFTTEGTGNWIHHNYIGLVAFCIRMGANANSPLIMFNRLQPNITSGIAIFLGDTGIEVAVAGFPNDVKIAHNIIERSNAGGVSGIRGVYVDATCVGVKIIDNRFEGNGLSDAIVKVSGADEVYAAGNYFESITGSRQVGLDGKFVSIDPTTGSRRLVPVAKGSILGTTGAARGSVHNATVSRTGVGTYSVVFTTTAVDTDYSIQYGVVASATLFARVSAKSTNGFTIVTESGIGTAADASQVDFVVYP